MRLYSYLFLTVILFSFSGLKGQDWRNLYGEAIKLYEANDLKSSYDQAGKTLEAYLKESGEVSENYASILRLLENICYSDGNFSKGLEFANKEVEVRSGKKDESYAVALSQQGSFLQALGNFAAADKPYRESFEILSQFYKPGEFQVAEAALTLGVNAYLNSQEEEAKKIFNSTLDIQFKEISPVFIQAYYFHGIIQKEDGDYNSSLRNFSKVRTFYQDQSLTNTTEFAALLFNTGLCYHFLKDWDKAESEYLGANTIYETLNIKEMAYSELVNARAVNFQAMGHPDKAEKMFSSLQGGEEGPPAAIFLSNKATFRMTSGDYRNAEQLFREALSKLDKNDKSHADTYAEIAINLATLFDILFRFSEAEKILTEAEALASEARLISITISKANMYSNSNKFDQASTSFRKALDLISSSGKPNQTQWANAATGTGLLFYKQGNIYEADSVFSQVLFKYNSGTIVKDNNYPVLLNNLSAVKQTQGEYLIARNLLNEAAYHTRKRSGVINMDYARALQNIGFIDLDIGALAIAKIEIDSSLIIYEKLVGPNSLNYSLALINKGKYHMNAGEYALAEPCFKRAFEFLNSARDVSAAEWVKSANALALFYQTMGNYDQAEPLFRQIREKIEKTMGKNTIDYATTLQNLATLYQLQEKLSLSSPLLEEALAIDKKIYGDNHPQYLITLRNLAAIYQKTGKKENAKILLELALNSTRNIFGENHPAYASTLSNLAALYQDQGNMKEAEKAWLQSVALRQKLLGEQHPDYARSLYGLASVYFGQGKLNEANTSFKLVISHYLRQIHENFPSLSEKEKGAFYQKIKPVFDSYQDFCIQYYKKNSSDGNILRELYNTQLATKAILLNSSNKVRHSILSSGDSVLVNKFRKWLSLKEQIVHHYSLSSEGRKQSSGIELLRQHANDLEKELSLNSTLFKAEFSERQYTTADIVAHLNTGEAAAEILRIQKKFVPDSVIYAALILEKGSDIPSLVIWPLGEKLETRLFRFHRNAVKFHIRDTISYNHYWRPFTEQLAGVKKLYLSADGVFNKINFNILQNNSNHHWILEDFTIHLLSNTKEIVENAARKPSSISAINLYGYADFQLKLDAKQKQMAPNVSLNRNFGFDNEIPMLPGTEKEVDEIQKIFQQKKFNVAAFKGMEASESNIKKTPHVKILHIATHGFFMNDIEASDAEPDDAEEFFNNPLLRSGILLSGAGVSKSEADLSGEDGILTAYEAMNINLDQTDLVVLSACETALGELRNGEGVYGLQRAFIVAGAGAVMMSLWQVDDVATQELMVDFYHHWLNGDSKHEAFRKAQLMIKEKYTSPYYWGAFILVGQ